FPLPSSWPGPERSSSRGSARTVRPPLSLLLLLLRPLGARRIPPLSTRARPARSFLRRLPPSPPAEGDEKKRKARPLCLEGAREKRGERWPGTPPRLLGLLLCLLAVALSGRGYADDSEFPSLDSLGDFVTTKRPTHKPPRKTSVDTDDGRWNIPHTTTTKQPKTTKPPPKNIPGKDPMDFDLSDALDNQNDRHPGGGPPKGNPGGGISDDDLIGIVDEGGYQPDKKKGDSDNDYNNGALVETGTIAGIVSGLAMALIGAVSSYISYQQKKFCFSIQQGLNAEYVKGENMEAVVTEEPQVKYSVLEPQTAEAPPPQENAKV
uniref:CD99 antigen-like protein 2 n=1 Tax=Laticauda laticaudata TaxID=8630 RepID=A0A8C5SBL9_LATLA